MARDFYEMSEESKSHHHGILKSASRSFPPLETGNDLLDHLLDHLLDNLVVDVCIFIVVVCSSSLVILD